jgi:putative two-component system response regulator
MSKEAAREAPRTTVLIVDDEAPVTDFLRRLLERDGYIVRAAADGDAALADIAAHPPDIVLLDVNLPGLNGFEVCRRLRRDSATRLLPVIMVTGRDATADRVEGLDAGADDFLTKPVETAELMARVRSLARMKAYTDDLESASAIIATLAQMIEARDGYSHGHCYRMANYATGLGRALQVDEADIQTLYRGGFLHDIGMLAISDEVVRRPGPLTAAEFEHVKSHTVVGEQLIANLHSLGAVRPIVRWHHEHLDGSGYPDGLRDTMIPLVAQIVGVVDVYEAVTTERPYQPICSKVEAIAILRDEVARGWRRSDIVETFVGLLESRAIS